MDIVKTIDWAPFNRLPEMTCTCKCGAVFRSHGKAVLQPQVLLVSRKPCPACHGHEMGKASGDPETILLTGRDRETIGS
jgi:hypothetical protein